MQDSKYYFKLQRHHEILNVVKRRYPSEPSTMGFLTVTHNDKIIYRCFTIENGGASSSEANKDRRIMPGKYNLSWAETSVPLPQVFCRKGLLLSSPTDSGFIKRRIFIHQGNYPQDTQGCILLQATYDLVEDPGYGCGSSHALVALYQRIKGFEPKEMELEIKDY